MYEWFNHASKKSGGRSYAGFVQNMRNDALANATEQERKMISASGSPW